MKINLNQIEIGQIFSGLCIVAVLGLWHSDMPSISSSLDMRVIHRATGDLFLENFLTRNNFQPEDIHSNRSLVGRGLYDFVRQFARALIRFLPVTGQNFVLDFSPGELQDLNVLKVVNF